MARAATLGLLTALAVAGSAGAATPPTPVAAWQKVSPASVGLDPAKLDQIAARARKGKSNCLVVVRDGKLAGEWYFNGTGPNTTQDVYSATKSVASTLVGIAQDDGDLRIGEQRLDLDPAMAGHAARAVTVRDLLSMDSGRQWSVFTDYVQLLGAADRTRFAIGLRQSGATGQGLGVQQRRRCRRSTASCRRRPGKDVLAFAQQRLFAPLGMTHTRMTTDKAGNAQMFEGLQSTCRDMARFGVLMLDQGRWGGKQIVSASWVEAGHRAVVDQAQRRLRLPLVAQPQGHRRATSSRRDERADGQAQPRRRAGIAPGAPSSMYWALGLGNQIVQVDPDSKTVVVRLGDVESARARRQLRPARREQGRHRGRGRLGDLGRRPRGRSRLGLVRHGRLAGAQEQPADRGRRDGEERADEERGVVAADERRELAVAVRGRACRCATRRGSRARPGRARRPS